MTKKVYSGMGLLLLAVAFLVFTLLNNTIFSGMRLDLTENNLYTLSDGSKKVIDNIEEPINLYFFFSEDASKDLTSLRVYAKRVQELLEEYALYGGEKINLRVIDPEPFSEAEDQAAEFGLRSVPVDGETDLYFGLAATNALDDRAVIPFFQPDKEEFLEYEISKVIHGLTETDPPDVGLMSSLPVQGNVNPQTFQSTKPWVVVEQMQQLFEVETVAPDVKKIPDNIEMLVVIHPKDLSEETLFAIDQFVMNGGRLLAFVDPLSQVDRPGQQNPMMPTQPTNRSSSLDRLLNGWGVTLRDKKVLADSQVALQVTDQSGAPVRHLAILGLQPENLAEDDVVTAALENINVATAGILDVNAPEGVEVTPLIQSSSFAMPMDASKLQFLRDPSTLQQEFEPTGERYKVAVRLSGKVESAFPDGIEGHDGEVVSSTDNLNAIVVADTDILSDRLWVRSQSFLGQQVHTPWANNGDFAVNAVENLVGNSALISIRSRGQFTRPFDRVQELRRKAEARYLESAQELQARLAETERKLSELQQTRTEQNVLSLSPEQQEALEQFQEEKLRIRKQLREVRHELDEDIEQLGATLKFINVVLFPILLTLLLLLVHYVFVSRRRAGLSQGGGAS